MRLPLFVLGSFFLVSCSVSPARTVTYVSKEQRCEIWLSYHEECVKMINSANTAEELYGAEKEASDVRLACSQELDAVSNADSKRSIWTEKILIARGEAMLAADAQESAIRDDLSKRMEKIAASADDVLSCAMLDPEIIGPEEAFLMLTDCIEELKSLRRECSMLGLEKEHDDIANRINELCSYASSAYRPLAG